MRRRRLIAVPGTFPAPERPAPTYPEYENLRADAEASVAADGHFVDPVKLRRVQDLRRSWEWRVSVLGHDDEHRTLLDMHMLLLADQRDLDPPVPQWLVEARAEGERRDAEKRKARQDREDADMAVWEKALAQAQVELAVLRNGTARPRHGLMHNLGHAVPKVDAVSGRSRRHRAGRALCETETRAKPLDLTGGEGGAVTCTSCLNYTPKIRPADTPPA